MTESESVALPLGDIAILFRTRDIIAESDEFVNTFLKFFPQTGIFLFCVLLVSPQKAQICVWTAMSCRVVNFFQKDLEKAFAVMV